MQETRKIVKYVRDLDKDKKVNIGFSSVTSRSDRNLGQEINIVNSIWTIKEQIFYVKTSTIVYTINWSSTNNRKIDITNLSLSKDIDQILFDLKSNNPSNLNFAYLNINSVRNKFENFKEIINGNVDIFTIAETKVDGSFPISQFELEGYYSPFRLDITKESGELLVYIKSSIPSR